MSIYEPPSISEIGSVADLTRGDAGDGNHDSISYTAEVDGVVFNGTFNYGVPPGS